MAKQNKRKRSAREEHVPAERKNKNPRFSNPHPLADSAAGNSDTSTSIRPISSVAKTWCYRISGIPQEWDKDRLLRSLRASNPTIPNLGANEFKISIHPACHGSGKTALFDICPRCNSSVSQDIDKYLEGLISLSDEDFRYDRSWSRHIILWPNFVKYTGCGDYYWVVPRLCLNRILSLT
jgi:hypothetical protein